MDYTQLIDELTDASLYGEGSVTCFGKMREAATAIEALQARVAELEKLSVTNVMLDVVPGDGSGFEVYAESVDDVVNKLSKIGGELEDWQLGIKRYHDFDKIVAERDAALAKLAEVEGQEPVAWGVGHDNQWGQRVWFDFTASLLLAGDVAAKHCTQFNSNAEPFPLFARPVIAAGAQPSEALKTYMQGYSDGKAWALEEAAKICDSTPPLPFRPSIEAAWAIRKLGEGL